MTIVDDGPFLLILQGKEWAPEWWVETLVQSRCTQRCIANEKSNEGNKFMLGAYKVQQWLTVTCVECCNTSTYIEFFIEACTSITSEQLADIDVTSIRAEWCVVFASLVIFSHCNLTNGNKSSLA